MKLKNRFMILEIIGFLVFQFVLFSLGWGQNSYSDVPEKIDTRARFLFYLHGKIVEDKGIRPISEIHGAYEYEQIVDTLKNKGFIVISEVRPINTNPKHYAVKVVSQVNRLLQAGVPPANITVVGASKGGLIAVLASTLLGNKEVNFVILAGCSDVVLHKFDIALYGNILSIYDEKDQIAGTCRKFFENSTGINKSKEIVLSVGTGHGIVYKPLKEWIDPVVQWARGEKKQ